MLRAIVIYLRPFPSATSTVGFLNTRYAPLSHTKNFSHASLLMDSIKQKCDYLVIGGGSGGLASARRAGSYGAKTIVVESKKLGGTCVNVGCVPKKVTFYAASIAETLHQAQNYGFSAEETKPFNWTYFKQKRDAYVKRLNKIYEHNLEKDNVQYIHGKAHIVGKNEVEVSLHDGSKQLITAEKILIAVGGHPSTPPDIPGAEFGINSDGFFELETQPKKVALVGSGYIAVEFAGIFNSLKSDTHIFIRQDHVLRKFDTIVQETITDEYEQQGIHVHKKSLLSRVEKNKDTGKLTLYYHNSLGESKIEGFDCLIWATGRSPEVKNLGLEQVGVKQDKTGYIIVDAYQATNVDHIYSLGDVVGKIELTPVAIAAGRKLSDRLFGPDELRHSKFDYKLVPSVVFSHPEVGSVGLSEAEAIEMYGEKSLKIYQTSFTAMYYAMMEPQDKAPTKYKLICVGESEKIVGLHIIGLGSAEILQGFAVAIKMGATKANFDDCTAIHPTSSEELVTLK